MKPSEILREAARIASDVPFTECGLPDQNRCGCGAILDAAGMESDSQANVYFELFRPNHLVAGGWFGSFDLAAVQAKEHRILALCLAAAIAESDGQ